MDIKDTEQQGSFSKGHSFRTATMEAFLHKQETMSFISKKTDKIVTALYMVTDFIPQSEPLRVQLRTVALSVMSSVRILAARSVDTETLISDDVLREIDEALALISIATTIGLMSHMNGSILSSELGKNQTEIRRLYAPRESASVTQVVHPNLVLSSDFFEVETPAPAVRISSLAAAAVPAQTTSAPAAATVEKSVLYKKTDTVEARKEVPQKSTGIGIKIARRSDVLAVIKSRGSASIKDISSVVKDMSEKTVQRELLTLVKEGVLKKEGEKRWSTYRLA